MKDLADELAPDGESGGDESWQDEVIADLKAAGLKCSDWGLLVSTLQRIASGPVEDVEIEDEGGGDDFAAALKP